MHATYLKKDDIFALKFSNKKIVREASQDWHTHISYAKDGTTVEVVILDAKANGLIPIEKCPQQVA